MVHSTPFKRLILRVVLRNLSPMVIRLVGVPDDLELIEFHEIFRAILGWSSNLDYIFRVHGQEFNSFRRATRSKTLRDFRLHRQEKFLYVCDAIDLWEWDVRVVDIQPSAPDNRAPVCLGGRGATPPEFCGGPRGYRLMLKRQGGRTQRCWKPAFRCWQPLIRSNRPAVGIDSPEPIYALAALGIVDPASRHA